MNKPPEYPKIVPVADIPSKDQIIDTPVDDLKKLYTLCCQMQYRCVTAQGVGLSALQIGIPWRLFVAVRDAKSLAKFRYFINCDYTPESEEKILSIEGCLSVRTEAGAIRRFKVQRYSKIRLTGKELKAEDKLQLVDVDEVHDGELAIILQHEADHHRGLLISDIGEEINLW